MSGIITENTYDIHYYEVDYKKRLLVSEIINYMCDSAMGQSCEIGEDIEFLKQNNIGWVILKWDINIERYPLYKEKVRVTTWGQSFNKFYATRGHEIIDEEGNVIGSAKSLWILIDTTRRRPVRIPDYMYGAYGIGKEDTKGYEFSKLDKVDKEDYIKKFNVRYSDIDTNVHVNNSKYLSWFVESVPKDIVLNYSIKRILINYEKETSYGELISSICAIKQNEDELEIIHEIKSQDGKSLTLGKTFWKKLS
ncbi:MAG: acyl-[acyl-carrier-protein] thioesterase [Clostridiaceae bacterium]